MLERIAYENIPQTRGNRTSPIRAFAADTLDEFFERSEPDEIYEITDWPDHEGEKRKVSAKRLTVALRTEIYNHDYMRNKARTFQRGERVFIERTAE